MESVCIGSPNLLEMITNNTSNLTKGNNMGVKKFFGAASAFALAAVPAAFAETSGSSSLQANTVSIPSGINITELISSGVAVLGGIVAVALAAWAGWLLIKKCLQWIRRAFS